ncbi:hypothetical protein ACLOJK_012782 [Asimina triloba]
MGCTCNFTSRRAEQRLVLLPSSATPPSRLKNPRPSSFFFPKPGNRTPTSLRIATPSLRFFPFYPRGRNPFSKIFPLQFHKSQSRTKTRGASKLRDAHRNRTPTSPRIATPSLRFFPFYPRIFPQPSTFQRHSRKQNRASDSCPFLKKDSDAPSHAPLVPDLNHLLQGYFSARSAHLNEPILRSLHTRGEDVGLGLLRRFLFASGADKGLFVPKKQVLSDLDAVLANPRIRRFFSSEAPKKKNYENVYRKEKKEIPKENEQRKSESKNDHGNFQENFVKQLQNYITPLIFIGLLLSYFSFGPRDQKQGHAFCPSNMEQVLRELKVQLNYTNLNECRGAGYIPIDDLRFIFREIQLLLEEAHQNLACMQKMKDKQVTTGREAEGGAPSSSKLWGRKRTEFSSLKWDGLQFVVQRMGSSICGHAFCPSNMEQVLRESKVQLNYTNLDERGGSEIYFSRDPIATRGSTLKARVHGENDGRASDNE